MSGITRRGFLGVLGTIPFVPFIGKGFLSAPVPKPLERETLVAPDIGPGHNMIVLKTSLSDTAIIQVGDLVNVNDKGIASSYVGPSEDVFLGRVIGKQLDLVSGEHFVRVLVG